MVDFAGWDMPVMYRSIHEEHNHVRQSAGLFDVSHMGRIKITGAQSLPFLEWILTRRVGDMPPWACRYSLICNPRGGVLDDVIVYRFDTHWMLVVNASNREKILAHLRSHANDFVIKIEDLTASTAMIALQGPRVMELVGRFSTEIPSLKRYRFCMKNMLLFSATISRTGYTGEDGVEVILPASMAGMALKMLLSQIPNHGDIAAAIKPIGLGARDTLRMEAGMPLYGHELDESTDPLSAGLRFAVDLEKQPPPPSKTEAFIGANALRDIASHGPQRRLVGLKLEGRRTPRQSMPVHDATTRVGQVTSGCLSPTLGTPIAMAFVQSQSATPGARLTVELGAQRVPAEVVTLPFYKRP
jgi:aminomethyltransferase